MPVREIGTIGGLVEYLVEQGIKVGVAAEIVAKAFGYGVDSAKFRLPENLVAPQITVSSALMSLEEVPKPREKRQTKKALHRIPDDFTLTPDLRKYATDRNFTSTEIESMWTKFYSHHKASGKEFVDWNHAWLTWVLRSVEYKSQKQEHRNTGF